MYIYPSTLFYRIYFVLKGFVKSLACFANFFDNFLQKIGNKDDRVTVLPIFKSFLFLV